MTDSIWFRSGVTRRSRRLKTIFKTLALSIAVSGCIEVAFPKLLASDDFVVGQVRVQLLSDSLVRLELKGPKGFENRPTFHVVNRDWPGVSGSSNSLAGEVIIGTPGYVVHVPQGATSLNGTYVATPSGEILYKFNGALNNSVWLPGPADQPKVFSFADSPRLIPPPGGVVPVPANGPFPQSSGWDTNNDSADVYVFVPGRNYRQLRKDFLKLTGPSEMPPLYAFGSWDSRWYDYNEASALAQIEEYRSRRIPLDVLVCDTGWRLGASTGYQPNSSLFPNLPRFFSEAHSKNVRVMFNDHPEPVATKALAPEEVNFRYAALTDLLDDGLDVWWYDRNWSVSLLSPSSTLRHEVWGMAIFHDATKAAKPSLRPMIMANIDGIDNGVRNRPPNVAAHRYSIQWTGDIGPSMTYLRYAVENAVHSGVQSLFPYESDDLGGHVSDPSPSGYIRWIEYGALSPTYRPHCTYNLTRMPWTFGADAEWIARRFINLRYRLLPLFYSAAHENFDSGEPILRRLDLDYPQYPEAQKEDQYLLGHSILVAPVISDGLAVVPSGWLRTANGQPGLNAAYFSNTNLSGIPAFTRIDEKIDFNWDSGSPGNSVPAEDWSARWTGKITIPAGVDDVKLATLSDDGIRVWIDNELRIDNWGPNNSVTIESPIVLKAGQTYALRVEYLQMGGNDIVALKWRVADATRAVWVPPGNWINAWTGAVLKGPVSVSETSPLDRIPLYIRSGSIIALAPEMQFTGQQPWSPVTLDVYPSTTETDRTSLYEDDATTVAYKSGEFRTTALTTWADDANRKVSVLIEPAQGNFPGAISQRSWIVRWHRPSNWPSDLMPTDVTLNGQSVGPIVRRVKNTSAMPLGDNSGAPDSDVFEVTLPESSVLTSNLVVATFASAPSSPWVCGDITEGAGNVFGGGSILSNSVWKIRGAGSGFGGTSDGFHFLFQPCLTNAELTVRLSGQASADSNAEAGIMIRESLEAPACNVTLAFRANNHLVFQKRSSASAAVETTEVSGYSAPCWLRLVRSGNDFTASASEDRVTWTKAGSVTIPGFSPQACIGIAVTAGITSSNSVDNAGYNEATFDEVISSNTVAVSIVPDQTAAQAASIPPIPFNVSTLSGSPVVVSASSSNSNLLSRANIVITGTGETRWITLTPAPGAYGACVITLTANDGVGLARTQFTLNVLPLSGVLLTEDFINYSPGNLPGQAYQGTGFANGVWAGLNVSFNANVPNAGVVSLSGLSWRSSEFPGGKVRVQGSGVNVEGVPDLSTNGIFAAAGLLDSGTETIGGGGVSGALYVSFLLRAVATNHNGEYGGLHLSRGTDSTGVLIGNEWNATAYSADAPQTGKTDLRNNIGDYLLLDNEVHLLVARINYNPGSDDTVTIWLDPVAANGEMSQDSSATYIGNLSGDFSFDRILLRGGNDNPFEYGRIRMGTSWSSVLPESSTSASVPPFFTEPPTLTNDDFQFSFSGLPGQFYSILATSNLSSPNWEIISTGSFGFDPVLFRSTLVGDEPQMFYRISVP